MEKILSHEGMRLEFAGEIKLTIDGEEEWQTDVLDDAARELDMQLELHPPEIRFPFAWVDEDGNGGPPVSDPLLIDLKVPFTLTDQPVWRYSLREVIRHELQFFNGKWIDPAGDVALMESLKAGLLDCVADIDEAIAKIK